MQFRQGLAIQDPDIVRTVLTIFWLLAEPVRLTAGYYGNLHENVRSQRAAVNRHRRRQQYTTGSSSTHQAAAVHGSIRIDTQQRPVAMLE